MFVHNVIFWLKEGTSEAERDQVIVDCNEILAKCPDVRHLWAGVPANTPRPIVDNSYSLALTVVFDDVAGHDVYQEHPLHKEFIARNERHFGRITVYDFQE